MTQTTHNDTVVISDRVRLVRRNDWHSEAHFVYQDEIKIGFVFYGPGHRLWRFKSIDSDYDIGHFDTRGDATDALIRYCSAPV